MKNQQENIIEIETKIVYLEDTVEQLNSVIINQQKQIDQLKKQILNLSQKVDEESVVMNRCRPQQIIEVLGFRTGLHQCSNR